MNEAPTLNGIASYNNQTHRSRESTKGEGREGGENTILEFYEGGTDGCAFVITVVFSSAVFGLLLRFWAPVACRTNQ